jgi:hypothetical protein
MNLTPWRARRMDYWTMDGSLHVLDTGSPVSITIIVKGPFVDLKLENVRAVQLYDMEKIDNFPDTELLQCVNKED